MGLGVGAWTAAMFHLFTHAFFKANLFLGAGSVSHSGSHHSFDMKKDMGGLRKYMPQTFITFVVGSAALAGIFPLAGFWSKDELLVAANDGHPVLFVILLSTALLTAFYMTRCVILTFFGEHRGQGHPHESPASMTGVLVALALATVGVGFLGAPQLGAVFGQWVFFGEPEAAHFLTSVAGLSIAAAVLGVVLGWVMYRRVQEYERDPLLHMGTATTVLENRYYIDAFYMRAIVLPVRDKLSAAVYWTNQNVIDAVVNGAGAFAKRLARGVMWFDRNVVDGAVNGIAGLAGFTGGLLRYIQSGNVQRYAAFLFTGVIVLAIIFTRI
jgi:NADH-quinone oxidoreductase subunit L